MPNDAGDPARAASSDDVAGDAARPEHFATMRELSRRTRPVFETTPRFSPDGARLVYVSNVGGVRAVFVDALDGSPPRLVAPAPQRMRRPFVAPDGEHLLYTADEGGDVAYALFRMHLETGAIEAMTPGEKLRREGPWFTDDLSRFFFTARRHDETGAKLYEQSSELGAEPRLVFDDPALRFAGLRGDGARVLLLEATLGRELFVLDLPANAPPRRVFPHAGSDARVMSVAFSIAQPGAALVATDDGGEGAHVVAIDLESGAELARYTEARFLGRAGSAACASSPIASCSSSTRACATTCACSTHRRSRRDRRSICRSGRRCLARRTRTCPTGSPSRRTRAASSCSGRRRRRRPTS